MKDEEKNLIENLFHRLKKTESNSSERDSSADDLIQKLVKKQPASSYYMAQTILIQETAIKKMSLKIEELKTRIKALNPEELNKKPSFLSSFFKKSLSPQKTSNNDHIWNKNRDIIPPNGSNTTVSSATQQSFPTATNTSSRSSSFLSSALQTATGVAGGMILGNMLMNVFSHTKPEEDIFDTVNQSSLDQHSLDQHSLDQHSLDQHSLDQHVEDNNNYNNDLINYEYNDSNINTDESSSDNMNDDIYHTDDIDDDNFDDDHFI